MRKYIKWDIINSYLTIPEYNELDVLKLVYNAVRELNVRDIYTQKVCTFEIKNHKADLPKDLKKIEMIAFLHNNNLEHLQTDCPDCVYPNLISTTAQQVTAIMPMLPYQIVSSRYFNKYFRVLKWANLAFAGKYGCRECPNFSDVECQDTYDIIPELNQINFHTIKEGIGCISYIALPEDEENNLLIPDDARVFEIIAAYVKLKYWEVEKQMADYMNYNRCNTEYSLAKREYVVKKRNYIGERTMEGLDYDKMEYRSQGKIINLLKSRK